jgi:hypothetical protein
LQASEFLEGALIIALGGVHAVLEAGESLACHIIGSASERQEVLIAVAGSAGLGIPVPELGFDAAEAAEGPLGVDEDVDEAALLGGVGEEAVVVVGGEGFEVGGIFAGDDLRGGVDAGFDGVEAGGGFAGGGAGSGGFLRVTAARFDLELGAHRASCPEGSRRDGGTREREGGKY